MQTGVLYNQDKKQITGLIVHDKLKIILTLKLDPETKTYALSKQTVLFQKSPTVPTDEFIELIENLIIDDLPKLIPGGNNDNIRLKSNKIIKTSRISNNRTLKQK
jgi:hypothetical protein